MQRLNRFARYWDLISNSGRFSQAMKTVLQDDPFQRFLALSDWIYAQTRQTHQIALDRLFELVYRGTQEVLQADAEQLREALVQDYLRTGLKKPPKFMQEGEWVQRYRQYQFNENATPKRQARHLAH